MDNFDDLVVSGLSRSTLSRHAAKGKIVKITTGLYCRREPTPDELARIVMAKWPGCIFTAQTARQIHLKQELTFPLHVTSSSGVRRSVYFTVSRCKQVDHVTIRGLRCHIPILAVDFLEKDDAVALLERTYAGTWGRDRLEHHLSLVTRLPSRTRRFIALASTGSDSAMERKLVKALRARRIKVLTNYKIGPYLWDLYLPELKVAVEVDGFEFHNDRQSFIKDHWKANDATMRGYTVLRYTGSCIMYQLANVVNQIVTAGDPNLDSLEHQGVWEWHWNYVR